VDLALHIGGALMKSAKWRFRSSRSQSGQGIIEYCFVIAFVSILIALAFNLAHGSLFAGLSGAYSNCNGALDKLNNTAVAAGQNGSL
jgi:hypothetical protein